MFGFFTRIHPRNSSPKVAYQQSGILWLLLFGILPANVFGDDSSFSAQSKATEKLLLCDVDQDLKRGWICRDFVWLDELTVGETRRIARTLFKGNDYRCYACVRVRQAVISLHIQDEEGKVVETRSWQKQQDDLGLAGVDFHASSTHTYYLVAKLERSPAEHAGWALAYAYK